jgi:hypothetical protein
MKINNFFKLIHSKHPEYPSSLEGHLGKQGDFPLEGSLANNDRKGKWIFFTPGKVQVPYHSAPTSIKGWLELSKTNLNIEIWISSYDADVNENTKYKNYDKYINNLPYEGTIGDEFIKYHNKTGHVKQIMNYNEGYRQIFSIKGNKILEIQTVENNTKITLFDPKGKVKSKNHITDDVMFVDRNKISNLFQEDIEKMYGKLNWRMVYAQLY